MVVACRTYSMRRCVSQKRLPRSVFDRLSPDVPLFIDFASCTETWNWTIFLFIFPIDQIINQSISRSWTLKMSGLSLKLLTWAMQESLSSIRRREVDVIELFPSKGRLWWCQQNKYRHTGAVAQGTATRSMCGPSVWFSTKCWRECSFSTWPRRHPIKWHFSSSIARLRKEPGLGLKTFKSPFNASNSSAIPCSRTH